MSSQTMHYVALLACLIGANLPITQGRRLLYTRMPVNDQPWSLKASKLSGNFQSNQIPLGKDQSSFAPFLNRKGESSISKATEFLATVKSGVEPDPFPHLKSFFIYSVTESTWYRFARKEKSTVKLDVDRQMIITVQSGQDSLYCLKDIKSRVSCAIVYDLHSKSAETAGTWTIRVVPVDKASKWAALPDMSDHFGGSFSKARDTLLKTNGHDLDAKAFVVRSVRAKDVVHVFQKQKVSIEDRIKYVEALGPHKKAKTYPAHVCPGGVGNVDIKEGKVLPFPGASSWMLQLKWTKQGKQQEKSPILDMEDDWHNDIKKINEDPGRVRIYFVGHSSKKKDWFGSRTERAYNSEKVARMLVKAGMTKARPITISFVACNAAMVFCPALARKLSSLGFKQVTLHCREPEVARWTGGELIKKTLRSGTPVYKGSGTKTIFKTDAADPGVGISAYLQLQSEQDNA